MTTNKEKMFEIYFWDDIKFLAGLSLFLGLGLLSHKSHYFNQDVLFINWLSFSILVIIFIIFKANIVFRQNSAIVFQNFNFVFMILLAIPFNFSFSLNLDIPYLIIKIRELIGFDISSIFADYIIRLLRVFQLDITFEKSMVLFWIFFILLLVIGGLLLLISFYLNISIKETLTKDLIYSGFIDIENKIWLKKPIKEKNPGIVIDLRFIGIILISIFVIYYLVNLFIGNISDIFINPSMTSGNLAFLSFYALLCLFAGRSLALAKILGDLEENTGGTFRIFE